MREDLEKEARYIGRSHGHAYAGTVPVNPTKTMYDRLQEAVAVMLRKNGLDVTDPDWYHYFDAANEELAARVRLER